MKRIRQSGATRQVKSAPARDDGGYEGRDGRYERYGAGEREMRGNETGDATENEGRGKLS